MKRRTRKSGLMVRKHAINPDFPNQQEVVKLKSIIVCDDDPFTLNMFSEMIEKIFIKYNVEAEVSCKASVPGEIRAYSAKSAHPFQRNGAPFRLKLSIAQLVN